MRDLEDLHDVSLVRLAQERDHGAFEVLIRRYQCILYTIAFGMFGRAIPAQKATVMALLRTYARLPALDRRHGFLEVAQRLLIDECFGVLRVHPHLPADKNGHANGAGAHDNEAFESTDSDEDRVPFRSLTLDERRRRLRLALLRLAPECRAVLVLRHLGGFSYEETSLTLAVSIDTVCAHLHTARQKLGVWLLGWHEGQILCAAHEALLHRGIDGDLDAHGRELRDRLLTHETDAIVRAAALRELAQLLRSLGPSVPPDDLLPYVLSHIAALGRP